MENNPEKIALGLALSAILLAGVHCAYAETVYIAEINGNIDAGTYQYIKRVLDTAKSDGAGCVILRMDTVGGFIKPTKAINEEIVNSRSDVRVAAYSYKKFHGAFSAGAYVLMASPIAAVDPQGYVGSAQPRPADNETVQSMKEYMAGLADINNRNTSLAGLLVSNNAVVDGKTALSSGLVEYAPESVPELLRHLNLSGAQVVRFNPTIDEAMLSFFSSPQILSFLLLPGLLVLAYIIKTHDLRLVFVPAVCLVVFLWGLANIQFSLFGVGLVLLGICLVSLEMLTTRPTIFGMAGGLSVAVGMIIADIEPLYTPGMDVTLVVLFLSEALVLAFVLIANRFGRMRLEASQAGTEGLINEKGRVVEELRPNGVIKINGKLRQAYSFAEEK